MEKPFVHTETPNMCVCVCQRESETYGAEVLGKLTLSQFQLYFSISASKKEKVTVPTKKKTI